MKNKVLEFEPINKRLYKPRLRGKYNDISLISVYAPTENSEEEENSSTICWKEYAKELTNTTH